LLPDLIDYPFGLGPIAKYTDPDFKKSFFRRDIDLPKLPQVTELLLILKSASGQDLDVIFIGYKSRASRIYGD
jgi:hypothetical protein